MYFNRAPLFNTLMPYLLRVQRSRFHLFVCVVHVLSLSHRLLIISQLRTRCLSFWLRHAGGHAYQPHRLSCLVPSSSHYLARKRNRTIIQSMESSACQSSIGCIFVHSIQSISSSAEKTSECVYSIPDKDRHPLREQFIDKVSSILSIDSIDTK